jgi:DNA helicase-2/ATP-dependent DNA helicase PcrA
MGAPELKEFDGVVTIEGISNSKLLDAQWDSKRTDEARRLLRVAITRARRTVVFVRPAGSLPLTPPLPATG